MNVGTVALFCHLTLESVAIAALSFLKRLSRTVINWFMCRLVVGPYSVMRRKTSKLMIIFITERTTRARRIPEKPVGADLSS